MISWMQKHNKYLVWTIWIATIAFIGAGFVGWGSYDLGSRAGNVAKIGNIEIKQKKINIAYSNLYNQYNDMMQGKLDKKKAKEMGLLKQAFSTVATQAKILNFAKDAGIIASDKEVADRLEKIKVFQDKGIFSREIYDRYLKSQRLKAKTFEETLKEDIIINKTLDLFNIEALPLELETVSAALNVSDKFIYKVLTTSDVNVTIDNEKLKEFWDVRKDNYMTKKEYHLSALWTPIVDVNISNNELNTYYKENSFNYTDAKGKQLNFEEAKENVIKDLKLKKTKKTAQKNYIAFKKGKLESSETLILPVNDPKLTKEVWDSIQDKNIGDIIKPKIVAEQYITLKIDSINDPKIKSYKEAKEEVLKAFKAQEEKEALMILAEATLKDIKESNANMSDFVTLNDFDNLKSLNSQESLQFLQKLFTSVKEKGIISVLDKVIVYNILDQRLEPMDKNGTNPVKQNVNQLKKIIFENNFIKILDKKYPTDVYVEGLMN